MKIYFFKNRILKHHVNGQNKLINKKINNYEKI